MSSCIFLDKITPGLLVKNYKRKNYPLFETGEYNINIFGIRADENVSNTFNDALGVFYKSGGKWVVRKYSATTDPGLYWRLHPMNCNGTAILQPGYYKGAFRMGYHQGKYPALVQNKPLTLWRDNNKDNVLDRKGSTYTEIAGINIHHAGSHSVQVDKWSAGCQVISDISDWNEFFNIIKISSQKYGSVFSYALFTYKEFFS